MPVAPNSPTNDLNESSSDGVAALLLRTAQRHPNAGIYAVNVPEKEDSRFLTYSALLGEARRILGGLRKSDYRPGSRVVLWLERPMDFLPAFWGCVLGGYVPCPLVSIRNDPTHWTKHVAYIDALLDHPLFVSAPDHAGRLPASVSSTDIEHLRRSPAYEEAYKAGLSDAAVVVLTSGSTGHSKAVVLTHENLLSSMVGKVNTQRLTAADVTLNWISFDHVAALLETHLLPLYVGATQLHIPSAAVLEDPLLFLRLIDQFRVSMTFSPNFLLGQINAVLQRGEYDSVNARHLAIDLSCLRQIISGGEASVVQTGRRFLELLAPHGLSPDALCPAFGMTETCAGSIYSREFPKIDTEHEFASVGMPIKGLKMRIVADQKSLVSAEKTGELQLKGPMIFTRYHNNEEATRTAFTEDGWFRTGDLGRIDDGRLTLVGRQKDSIIVSGANYFSYELENALEQLEGIERSFVAAFPIRSKGADTEQLAVAFATTFPLNAEERLYQLVVAVRNTTIMLWGFRPALVLPLPKDAFQKTSLGKIQRSFMRERLNAGEFAADLSHAECVIKQQLGAYTSPDSHMEHEIVGLFGEMFGLSATDVSATANFFDLGGTSLEILKLTRILEQRFKFHTTLTTVLQYPTPRKLAACISSETRCAKSEYDPIVPMQTSGCKTPLFCIHPGNGGVLVYVNLAKYFVNERPLYALRPRGFGKGEECFETFEEMIGAYLNGICKYQPHGPYAILGYSHGSPLAFEIAKALQMRGEHVAFLGCIDAPVFGEYARFDFAESAVELAVLLGLIDRKQKEEAHRQVKAIPNDRNPCELVMEIASRERIAELALDVEKFSAWARVVRSVHTLCYPRKTSGVVDAMTVFYCSGAETGAEVPEWIKPWSNFVGQPRYVRVAGDHFTLMAPEHVADFQSVLRAEIEDAFRKQGLPS